MSEILFRLIGHDKDILKNSQSLELLFNIIKEYNFTSKK